jgi:hypothetical protein
MTDHNWQRADDNGEEMSPAHEKLWLALGEIAKDHRQHTHPALESLLDEIVGPVDPLTQQRPPSDQNNHPHGIRGQLEEVNEKLDTLIEKRTWDWKKITGLITGLIAAAFGGKQL